MSRTRAELISVLNTLVHRDQALDELSPLDFEALVAFLLDSLGYEARTWQEVGDHGIDIVVRGRDPLGMESIGLVECKKYRSDRPVGVEVLRALYAVSEYRRANWAAVITSSRFTRAAREFATHTAPRLRLVDRGLLIEWVLRARAKEEERVESIARRLDRLTLIEFGRLVAPTVQVLADTDVAARVALPSEYISRLVLAEQLPFRVLQAVLSDPRHLHQLTPRQFEEFVAEIVDGLDFKDVVLTPRSGDGGRDVIASKLVHGIPLTFFFECKKYAEGNKVQLDTLRALLGTVAHHGSDANIGVLVTTSTFTKGCRELIASECRLDGKDYQGLVGWIDDYQRPYPPGQSGV